MITGGRQPRPVCRWGNGGSEAGPRLHGACRGRRVRTQICQAQGSLPHVPQEANVLAAWTAWWPEGPEVFPSGRPGTALVMTSGPCLDTPCIPKPQGGLEERVVLVVRCRASHGGIFSKHRCRGVSSRLGRDIKQGHLPPPHPLCRWEQSPERGCLVQTHREAGREPSLLASRPALSGPGCTLSLVKVYKPRRPLLQEALQDC